MNNFEKLSKKTKYLSLEKTNFIKAALEWDLLHYYKSNEPLTCDCGHYPIVTICILKNKNNLNEMIVGNCCVKHFSKNLDWYFYNIKRLEDNLRPNKHFISYLYENNKINLYEFNFLINMSNKKKLSIKQQNFLNILINKIKSKEIKNEPTPR